MTKDDQQEASNWAKTILEKDNWVILDTETTGLESAQICQIATLSSSDEWQTLVSPAIEISKDATNIHGIHNKDVAGSPTFDQVFLELMKKIGRRDVIIYNTNFDLQVIKNSLRVHGIHLAFPTSDRRQCQIFTNGGSIHCAMTWYSQWCGDWNDYYGNYKWQRLPGGDHSALGDCKATLDVIKRMACEV